ncbi:hypothetical protein EDB86DRAFT_3239970, partial [Lactarius hatsudake]
MSQSSAPSSSSKTPATTPSNSNFKVIFETALKEYNKKTKQDLTALPIATQLQACDSPAAILTILQEQVDQFEQSRSGDEKLRKWLDPTINVLYAFSQTLGEGVGLVIINLFSLLLKRYLLAPVSSSWRPRKPKQAKKSLSISLSASKIS